MRVEKPSLKDLRRHRSVKGDVKVALYCLCKGSDRNETYNGTPYVGRLSSSASTVRCFKVIYGR